MSVRLKIKFFIFGLIVLSFLACNSQDRLGPPNPKSLTTDEEKGSYALGQNIGRGMKSQSVKINLGAFQSGIADALSGTSKLTDDEVKAALGAMQKATMQGIEAAGEKNGKEGAQFLAKNRNGEGWKVSPTGLQYKVIKEGKGPSPAITDFVKIDYVGTLINGDKFDSTLDQGHPATVAMHGVIPAWGEALKMMKAGGEMKLAAPPALAYGPQAHGMIGPNSTVLFDLTLIEINPASSTPQ